MRDALIKRAIGCVLRECKVSANPRLRVVLADLQTAKRSTGTLQDLALARAGAFMRLHLDERARVSVSITSNSV